jgi:phosphoheptose isomerase
VAIDTHFKMAAKLNAAAYGDTSKVELTGKDGGAVEIKADMTITAEQAYERLIKGK